LTTFTPWDFLDPAFVQEFFGEGYSMSSVTPAATGRAGAGFQDIKAGTGNIFRAVLNRSRLWLLVRFLPLVMLIASAAFPAHANGVVDTIGNGEIKYGNVNIVYVHGNQLGAPQKITNPSRTLVWDRIQEPFGEDYSTPTNTTPTNHRFPGQYADVEDTLSYNGMRDYDATLGRYIESDPLGFGGGYTHAITQ
jgi:RHS repeat-associated protein